MPSLSYSLFDSPERDDKKWEQFESHKIWLYLTITLLSSQLDQLTKLTIQDRALNNALPTNASKRAEDLEDEKPDPTSSEFETPQTAR